MATWNAWHGCYKISPGCQNCYMYYYDNGYSDGKIDSSHIYKTKQFDLPLKKNRKKEYKIKSGESVLVNMTSDTFLEEADLWREEMWDIIRQRPDVRFEFITKRIERVADCLPSDWGDGYNNVMICATCENQEMVDKRMPYLIALPAKHRGIMCGPLLGPVDVSKYLATGKIHFFAAWGEFYGGNRTLNFEWIEDLVKQSETYRVNFDFGELGNDFYKDGKHYRDLPVEVQRTQARKAGMRRKYYLNDYGEAGKFWR